MAERARDLLSRRSSNLGRLLFRGYRGINNEVLAKLEAAGHGGLRLGHVAVLSNVDLDGGTRPVVLADRAGVTKQAIGPVVRELENLGYVSTEPDPSDGRAKLVRFTAAGRAVILDAQPIIDGIEDGLRRQLGAQNFHSLLRLLAQLLASFDEGDAHPQS